MKKLSKTIAALSMSLLTVGAIAQTPVFFSNAKATNPVEAKGKYVTSPRLSHNPMSSTNYLFDNLNGDITNTAQTFYNWSPYLYLNTKFNNTDTLTSNNANAVTTVFTGNDPSSQGVWDYYSQSFVTLGGGTANVDTIAGFVRYHNTSGNADTIYLSVISLTASGYPGATVYGVDTIIVSPSFFPYNSIDSIQSFAAIKNIAIPNTALHGFNFGVKMTVQCNKALDTIALVYYGQGSTACGALGGSYIPESSVVGAFDSAVDHVNTFVNGEWSYNSPGNHGTGTSLSWPQLTSPFKGYYMNGGGYYYAPLALSALSCCGGCTGDTIQFAVQDVALFPSVSGVNNLGIKTQSATGLYVAQNYPNPFNKETTINYSVTKSSTVTFTVYDMTGRVITTNSYGSVAPGQYTINLSANTFSPGIYFYTFNVNGSVVTKKMVITE